MIQNFERIGSQLLALLAIPGIEQVDGESALNAKERAREARERALRNFQNFPNQSLNEDESVSCYFCHTPNNDVLCYPVCISETSIPSLLIKETTEGDHEIRSNFSIFLCSHSIHQKCCRLSKRGFQCAICKCRKLGLLPILSLSSNLTSAEVSAIDQFFEIEKLCEDGSPIENVIYSIVGLLQSIEIRQRNSPNCLRKETLRLCIKYLFLVIHYRLIKRQQTFNYSFPRRKNSGYFAINSKIYPTFLANCE
jgi:hypothetical protein